MRNRLSEVGGALAGAAALFCSLMLSACSAPGGPVTQTREFPFAKTTLTLYDHADDATFAASFKRIEAVLREFNMHSPDSEISAVNRAAGTGAVHVSEDFLEALRQGLRLASLTDGLFDPTVGPLVKLWGIGSDKAHVPPREQIHSALRLIGWKDAVVDEQARTVALRRPGMTLDFGALLKGFAAVETGRILAACGVRSGVVDVGGSVVALGSRPDGAPWRIGIQKPDARTGVSLGIVEVRDEAVNTSGSYEQFFTRNGRRYQHILDPRTGYPVDDGVVSVTVITDRMRNADGPTLCIMALGVEHGLAFAQHLGVDVIIVDSKRVIHVTRGVRGRFALIDTTYRMAAP